MKVIHTALPGLLLLEPQVFGDARGFFFESYNKRAFQEASGVHADFVQDNYSRSSQNVLRGLHYQIHQPQGKLVRVLHGEIYDVVVDIRRSSPTFGQWLAFALSSESQHAAWIPAGYAHGFVVVSEFADVYYKATDYYAPRHERSLLWSDPDLAIDWPLSGAPIVSDKDARGLLLRQAETYD
uniref:dTDP-4-dehydrorhamnose 3,5-epimerase n=1 Tax=uncultured bacterium CSL142 TaxID=1091569 RepID=G4WVM4_9BACT|nr:dTDP-4-dehydrorhamnose 3,5-epimerase [uncultured bacterium CSL142]